MRSFGLLLITLTWLTAIVRAGVIAGPAAQAVPPTAEQLTLLAHFGGSISAVAADGQRVFIAQGHTVAMLDISDPTHPMRLGRSPLLAGRVNALAIQGNYVYAGLNANALQIIDFSQPAAPRNLGRVLTPGPVQAVAVHGAYAFAALWNPVNADGLFVLDVSDPGGPRAVNARAVGAYAQGVAVAGSLVYAVADAVGLSIVDASQPTATILLGRYSLPDARAVAVVGALAYVTTANGNLHIIDVSDPPHPHLVSVSPTAGQAQHVVVANEVAYIADGSVGLTTIDVSQPAAPLWLATVAVGETTQVALAGEIALLTTEAALQLVAVAQPAAPIPLGEYRSLTAINDLAVDGDTLYLATSDSSGLVALDIHDLSRPVRLGEFSLDGGAYGLTLASNRAYVSYAGGVAILDVSQPAAPQRLGDYANEGFIGALEANAAGRLLVGVSPFLQLVDASDPAAPVALGAAAVTNPRALSTMQDRVYVADDWAGLRIIDISNPFQPVELGRQPTQARATDVAVAGDLAYQADDSAGFRVVDASLPNTPLVRGVLATAEPARAIVLAGNLAYGLTAHQVLVLAAANPDDLRRVADYTFDAPGQALQQIAVREPAIFVSTWDNGIFIFQHSTRLQVFLPILQRPAPSR